MIVISNKKEWKQLFEDFKKYLIFYIEDEELLTVIRIINASRHNTAATNAGTIRG